MRDLSTENRHYVRNNQSIMVGCEYLYYLESASRVKFFVGGGPAVRFTRSRYKSTTTDQSLSGTQSESSENTDNFWEYGVKGGVGIEWHVYEFLSLLAQYQVVATYGSHRYEEAYSSSTYSESSHREEFHKVWQVQLNSIQIGMSVYF